MLCSLTLQMARIVRQMTTRPGHRVITGTTVVYWGRRRFTNAAGRTPSASTGRTTNDQSAFRTAPATSWTMSGQFLSFSLSLSQSLSLLCRSAPVSSWTMSGQSLSVCLSVCLSSFSLSLSLLSLSCLLCVFLSQFLQHEGRRVVSLYILSVCLSVCLSLVSLCLV